MHSRLHGAVVITALVTPAVAAAEVDAPASEPAVPAGKPVPPPAFAWEAFGFLRMQYIAVQNDPNVAFVGRDDGFELQNARVGAIGRLGTRAAFVIAFDGAVDERAQINSPDGKLKVGLRDAFADVALQGATVVHAGYFQAWVDPEALVLDTMREFVDHPLESRGMRATEGWQTPGLLPGRSLGAAVRLDPAGVLVAPRDQVAPRVGFEVAIQNGADEFASNNDNDKPAVSAAVLVRLPNDGFAMGAVRYNPRTVGDLPFRQDETDYQGTVGLHVTAGPLSLGAGLVVQHTEFESTAGPAQNAYGGHAQILFDFETSLPFALGYRFGILDPSDLIVTDQVMEHTIGAVLGVPSLRTRLQLQLTHVQEQDARELSNDRVQLAAELAL